MNRGILKTCFCSYQAVYDQIDAFTYPWATHRHLIVVHAAGVRSVDLTWVGWGALARSVDKILTMGELKEKSPLSHRRMMLTSQKKNNNNKKNSSTKKKVSLLNSETLVDHTESCSIKNVLE